MSSVPNLQNYCVLFLVYIRLTSVAVVCGFDMPALYHSDSHALLPVTQNCKSHWSFNPSSTRCSAPNLKHEVHLIVLGVHDPPEGFCKPGLVITLGLRIHGVLLYFISHSSICMLQVFIFKDPGSKIFA